jgi:rRNA maturation endonuclease Nob1
MRMEYKFQIRCLECRKVFWQKDNEIGPEGPVCSCGSAVIVVVSVKVKVGK